MVISVAVYPGLMELTVMRCGAHSQARERVS